MADFHEIEDKLEELTVSIDSVLTGTEFKAPPHRIAEDAARGAALASEIYAWLMDQVREQQKAAAKEQAGP